MTRPSFTALSILIALLLTSVTSPHAQQQDRQLVQTGSPTASNNKRIALVIGNGTYTNAPPLKNPPNDAKDMADALSKLGFDVEHGVDLSQRLMKQMIREFGQKLKGGGQGLFYFAGHGVQLKGHNYLIPVDADIRSETEVEDQGVDADLVMGFMDEANNGLNVVILDACRNNPFARSFRSASSGLAQVDAPTGTLIAYATSPGRVARDGTGRNGAYTAELLKQMRVPGLGIEELLKRVRASLKQQTNGEQVPWESSSLVGDFYLNRSADASNAASSSARGETAGATVVHPAAVEQEYWETIKESNAAADFQAYLKEYPQGKYAPLARIKLQRLEAASKTSPPKASNTGAAVNAPNTAGSTKAAGKPGALVRNQMGMELVYVPAGSFMMGAENGVVTEKPAHQVTIRSELYMGRYEVTQAQWQAVMGMNPSNFKGCDQCPVEQVSWDDAQEFIRKLNARGDGYTYRLPTEAEWEYACRAGTTGDYAGNLDGMGWYYENSGDSRLNDAIFRVENSKRNNNRTHPVGSKQPNAWGLYDMHGNVFEWCEDIWHDNYTGAPTDGSAWLNGGNSGQRILRGGSWGLFAHIARSAIRGTGPPSIRDSSFGLRLVAVAR